MYGYETTYDVKVKLFNKPLEIIIAKSKEDAEKIADKFTCLCESVVIIEWSCDDGSYGCYNARDGKTIDAVS